MHVLLNIRHILFLKYLFGIMHVSRRSSQLIISEIIYILSLIICTPFVAENGDADVVVTLTCTMFNQFQGKVATYPGKTVRLNVLSLHFSVQNIKCIC